MPSKRRSTVLTAIGLAVATLTVLTGCAPTAAPGTTDIVGKWVSDSGSTLRLDADGQAQITNFPRAALQLNAAGAPVSGTAAWHTAKGHKLISFTGKELTWSEVAGASWTATLTDDSPRMLVFALQGPGLESSKELALRRDR